jgi:hypothetical protein
MTRLDANGDTKWEAALRLILVAYGITGWVREYRFSRPVGRNHRFDFCWPDAMLAALRPTRWAVRGA